MFGQESSQATFEMGNVDLIEFKNPEFNAHHVYTTFSKETAPTHFLYRRNHNLTRIPKIRLIHHQSPAGGKVVSVLCVVCGTVVVWCEDRCSATALVLRLLGDCWPCAMFCWVSCLAPSALHVLIVFLGKFCVPGPVNVAAALRDVLTSLRLTSPSSAFPSASLCQPGVDDVLCSSASGVYGGVSRW